MRKDKSVVFALLGVCMMLSGFCAAQPGEIQEISWREVEQNASDFTLSDWGPNTYLTCYLMTELPVSQLFAPTTKFSTVVEQWKVNCDKIGTNGRVSPDSVARTREALDKLSAAIQAANIQWAYRDAYFQDWDDAALAPVKRELENLKAAGANLAFPNFEHRDQFDSVIANLHRQGFGDWELADFFWTPASPRFKDDAINAISDALHEYRLLIGEMPDLVVYKVDGTAYRISDPENRSMCCSTTKRKCVTTEPLLCTMCGISCCSGSDWCT